MRCRRHHGPDKNLPTYQPTIIFTSEIHPNLARINKSNQAGGLAQSQKIVDTPKDAIPKDETHKHTTTFHLTTKTPHQLHPPSDTSIKITSLTLILPKETRSHRRILLGQCPTQAISRQCLLRPFNLRTLLDEGGNGASTRRRPNDARGASRAGQGCGQVVGSCWGGGRGCSGGVRLEEDCLGRRGG